MKKLKLNLAVDSIAVFDNDARPMVGIPPGWPESRYYDKMFSIFSFTPQELKDQFNFSFPINWGTVPNELKETIGHRIFPHSSVSHFATENVDITFDTVDYFKEKGENFIYLIHVLDDTLFKQEVFKISDNAIEQVKLNKAKVLIFFPAEGYINHAPPLNWLNEFAKLNQLGKDKLVFTHANLTLNKAIEELKQTGTSIDFVNLPVNYFEYNPWFLNEGSPHMEYSKQKLLPYLDEYIKENRSKEFRKHFNILNRRPHLHRIYLYSEIKSTPLLSRTSEISLGSENIFHPEHIVEHFKNTVYEEGKVEFEQNYEFIKGYDLMTPDLLDKDLQDNRAGEFNRDFYKSTFCSVTSETAVNINQMFFSEKTFKPIFNLQPFLLYGNQYSLKHLRELGYKTFDKWWDESYDNIADYRDRLKAMSKVMQDIATWSASEMYKITQEMEPTLVHNYYTFLYNRRYYEFVKELTDGLEVHSTKSPKNLI